MLLTLLYHQTLRLWCVTIYVKPPAPPLRAFGHSRHSGRIIGGYDLSGYCILYYIAYYVLKNLYVWCNFGMCCCLSLFWHVLTYPFLFDVILSIHYIWRGWTVSRSPRGRNLNFRSVFFEKTFIFPTYSTVPASGIARRDPPRHGNFGAQILVTKSLM